MKLTRANLERIPAARLETWLARQRWFGAKGRRVRGVRWLDVIPLDDARFAMARIVVALDDAEWEYQLPLALCAADAASAADAIGMIDEGGKQYVLVDGSRDAAWRAAIGDVLTRGITLSGDESRCEVTLGSVPPAIDASCSTVGSAEQSNTNIVFDERAILKLYRRLERGEHPDAELAMALSRAGFHDTPTVYATARVVDDRGASVTALMSEFSAGSVDAWSHVREVGARDFASTKAEFAAEREARRIGEITRAMHDALAGIGDDPAFAPESSSSTDVHRWAAAAHEAAAHALDLLAQSTSASRLKEATEILGRRDTLLSDLDQLADVAGVDPGMCTRHHGDYHLGQLLYTPDARYLVIDFEGEPSKSLADRRAKTSPLRDVAGMLRSFDYAAAAIAGTAQGSATDERREQWGAAMRRAFLAGYGLDRGASWLPRDHDHVRALLAIFEREKLFYELAYELNNRPDWAWIPLHGIARIGTAEND